MNDKEGLPEALFHNVPDQIVRMVEDRIIDVQVEHPTCTLYHIAMYVACQFAYQIATGGTK